MRGAIPTRADPCDSSFRAERSFVEGGYHSMEMLGARFNAATLSAGVTLRFPAMAGIMLVIP